MPKRRGRFLYLLLLIATIPPGCAREASIRPNVNDEFRRTPTSEWVKRFESESREIYQHREKVVAMVGLKPGQRIADIGAGTGFFSELFANRVGQAGHVYAVDIMPQFLELTRERANRAGLHNITTVLCRADSTDLPAKSVDVVFICDTYHHFEYPKSTLKSIHAALRPGGQLILIDFERKPGTSRPWVIEHVRAGRDVFTAEITAAGFELIESPATPFFAENYFLRFRRVEAEPRKAGMGS